MATRAWLDSSGILSSASNWSSATAPITGDNIYILTGEQDISGGLADFSAVNPVDVFIGNFSGAVGRPTTPAVFGAVSGDVRISNTAARQLCLQFTSAASVIIRDAGPRKYSCYILGTLTNVYVFKGGNVRIGNSCAITNLYVQHSGSPTSDSNVYVEPGATVTNLYMSGGKATLNCGVTTATVSGGTLKFIGEGAGNVTTLNQYAGVVYYNAPGFTLATWNGYGGKLDLSSDDRARTITNAYLYPGAKLIGDNGQKSNTLTNLYLRGGYFRGTATNTTEVVPQLTY